MEGSRPPRPGRGAPFVFALSPDGKTVAVHLQPVRPVAAKGEPLRSPELEGCHVGMYDAATFAHLRDLKADVRRFGPALSFSPDGKAVGVAYQSTEAGKPVGGIIEFDLATGKELCRCSYQPHDATGRPRINRIAYAPDGKRVVIVGGTGTPAGKDATQIVGAVHDWDRQSPRPVSTNVEGASGEFTAGLFSLDGKQFYLGNRGATQRSGPVRQGASVLVRQQGAVLGTRPGWGGGSRTSSGRRTGK